MTDIDEAKAILALQLKSSQSSISNLCEIKIKIIGFPLVKTFPLGYGKQTDWHPYSGYGQTDTVLESSYENMTAHKNFNLKLKISG